MSLQECPFKVGQCYRVKKSLSYLNHVFRQEEVVVFADHSYDPHHGITRFWFRKRDTDETNAWHVRDDEPTAFQVWKEHFEELSAACPSEL